VFGNTEIPFLCMCVFVSVDQEGESLRVSSRLMAGEDWGVYDARM